MENSRAEDNQNLNEAQRDVVESSQLTPGRPVVLAAKRMKDLLSKIDVGIDVLIKLMSPGPGNAMVQHLILILETLTKVDDQSTEVGGLISEVTECEVESPLPETSILPSKSQPDLMAKYFILVLEIEEQLGKDKNDNCWNTLQIIKFQCILYLRWCFKLKPGMGIGMPMPEGGEKVFLNASLCIGNKFGSRKDEFPVEKIMNIYDKVQKFKIPVDPELALKVGSAEFRIKAEFCIALSKILQEP